MPELPDITAYISALEARILHQTLQHVRLGSPFLLRTVQPPIGSAEGRTVVQLKRIGKRIAIGLEGDLWIVLHLMIAGRLHWKNAPAKLGGRQNLAAFDFPNGTLLLTEAGSKRRASLHLIAGESNLASLDAGGIDVFSSDLETFRSVLTAENHTLKRALTDPRLLSGIGNAYSDEILHAAQLSPITMTKKLTDEEWQRLYDATRQTLKLWISKLGADAERGFRRKSQHSVRTWRLTDATASPVPGAAKKYCASDMPTKRRTTAPAARREAKFSPTGAFHVCSAQTGRAPWTNWKP